MSCGADTTANALLASLLQGKSFNLPDVDLTQPQFQIPNVGFEDIAKITNADLTTKEVNGNGTFDILMKSLSNHIKEEFQQNRITGQQYTETYIAAMGGALQTAASFLLGRDQAHWNAVAAQYQALTAQLGVVTARVALETAKAQLAAMRFQALTAEAEYGLTKLKMATEDQQYCLLLEQTKQAKYTNDFILPAQKDLVLEQVEVQRAQTLDTRTNGATITGSVGKQKELYSQQITSYQRDAEVKAAKMFVDAWITQKTIDEGLLPPGAFKNESINVILRNIKKNNNIQLDPGAQTGDP